MKRHNFYLTDDQWKALCKEAKRHRVSVAYIIRIAIQRFLQGIAR